MTYFVDTNYFLRILIGEQTEQFEKVRELFSRAAEGTVQLVTSTIVLFELYWVLSSFYELDKDAGIQAVERVISMDFVVLEERNDLIEAIKIFKTTSLGFIDCYNVVLTKKHPSWQFATFDKKILSYFK